MNLKAISEMKDVSSLLQSVDALRLQHDQVSSSPLSHDKLRMSLMRVLPPKFLEHCVTNDVDISTYVALRAQVETWVERGRSIAEYQSMRTPAPEKAVPSTVGNVSMSQEVSPESPPKEEECPVSELRAHCCVCSRV